jgi:hypothetical protein
VSKLHPQFKGEHFAILTGLQEALRWQPEAPMLESWLGLAAGTLTLEDFYRRILAKPQLTYLTVDVTGICDLTCPGACYYHPEIDPRKPMVSEDILKKAILEAEDTLGLQTLVLAGKEPFLNPKRLFSLLSFCGTIPNRRFSVGVITNGRHIARRWTEVKAMADTGSLDFLDISIDSGDSAQHDAIRGRIGTWDLAISALREASTHLPSVRVGISSVLREDNADGILKLLAIAAPYTSHFFIVPIQPPPFSSIRPLEVEKVMTFLQRLNASLRTLKQDKGLEITVSLPGLYVLEAVQAGLFEWQDLVESHHGMIYARTQIHNHTVLYACSIMPEQACRIARITYDGAYLGHLHFLQSRTPEAYAVGFLQQESILALYEKSISPGSRFHQLLLSRQRHECRDRPCWSNCFGGWTVADNAFLTQYPLESKPLLCPKN